MLPRLLGERIDASSRFGSLMMVAEGSFLDISKSPGKDSPLLLALFSTKGLSSWSNEEPSFDI